MFLPNRSEDLSPDYYKSELLHPILKKASKNQLRD